MFQNISGQVDTEEEINKNIKIKYILNKLFTKQNIALYVISFLISQVSCGKMMAPFGLAIFASACSNGIPVGIVYFMTIIGTWIGLGTNELLNYLLTSLVFIVGFLIGKPKYKQTEDTKMKLGKVVFFSSLLVQMIHLLWKEWMVYDIILAISVSLSSYIFYKIFENSIIVIKEYKIKTAFSIEEVVGASIILAIASAAFGNFSIFGLQIRNILSILIVLILGWKNGILLGATSGVTIGAIMGIVSMEDPIIIAAFALSGLIAGVFSKLGKIGVIIGFIGGTILLTYVTNGNTVQIIYLKEILVASLGLLLVPNKMEINLEEFFPKSKCLPVTAKYTLEENKNAINQLNGVSETIKEISDTYKEVAATVVTDEEIIEQNKKLFIEELLNELEGIRENFLYDEISEENEDIMNDIFSLLSKKKELELEDLITIFENNYNYIVGLKNNKEIEQQVEEIVKVINNAYRISKVNFLWTKKIEENKKTISNQLEGVSKVISSIAEEMQPKEKIKNFEEKKQKIEMICKQKKIELLSIEIKQEKNKKYEVTIYLNTCSKDNELYCPITKIEKILSQVLEEKIKLKKENCGLEKEQEVCIQTYASEDKYKINIGMAKKTKDNVSISGDSSIKAKLEDGKYLLAISDGMGSRTRSEKK